MDAVPILYEDNDVVAVHKPEGLVSNAPGGQEGLAPRLAAAGAGRLYIVHRLDKGASGVLLLAKNAEAHKFLNDLFSRGEVRKTYVAVALGKISQSRGVIDKPIREFGSGRMGIDSERGKPSRTEFEVTERLKDSTLVKVRPLSGRRHQVPGALLQPRTSAGRRPEVWRPERPAGLSPPDAACPGHFLQAAGRRGGQNRSARSRILPDGAGGAAPSSPAKAGTLSRWVISQQGYYLFLFC